MSQEKIHDEGSEEPRDGFSRRAFLSRSGAAAGAAATTSLWFANPASAVPNPGSTTLIVINQRGGADGLSTCSPVLDSFYTNARPFLKIPVPPTGDRRWLDSRFALPISAVDSGMIDFKLAYDDGHATIVHGAGMTGNSRSHFEATKHMETGFSPGATIGPGGWWGRALQKISSSLPVRGYGDGQILARALAPDPAFAPTTVQAYPDVSTLAFPGCPPPPTLCVRRLAVDLAYQGSPRPIVKQAAADTLAAIDNLSQVTYRTGTDPEYPDSSLGNGLRRAADIIKDPNVCLEAVHFDVGGWDHHRAQGPNDPLGTFYNMIKDLSRSLGAFYRDHGRQSGAQKYLVIVMSEFGRRIAENSSLGTDHGTGNCMLMMGAGVSSGSFGSQVFAEFGALSNPASRFPNPGSGEDLTITIDYRDVLKEALTKRAGLNSSDLGFVFPGFTFRTTPPNIIG